MAIRNDMPGLSEVLEPRATTVFAVGLSIAGLLVGARHLLLSPSSNDHAPRRASIIQVQLIGSVPTPAESAHRVPDLSPPKAVTPLPREEPRAADTAIPAETTPTSAFGEQHASPTPAETTSQAGRAGFLETRQAFYRDLLAHLERFRRYPDAARSARLTGVVDVRFELNRDGTVIDAWVQNSSGSALLDDEALEILRRAQPLPAIPAMMGDRVKLVVPVGFALL